MKGNKMDWRIFHGTMIGFYLLGLIAFLLIGDLTETINQVLFGLFFLIVLREVIRFIKRLKTTEK
ncbi:hypothetical protein [Amphibacillus cookii]|uniref:hypothetical protein n=1 Tax=Amphibacillus cookii TaxID=767787 RepID=UPI00195E2A33|nr:hypothetical protein [Amphibacillus cookii]MBM7540253.1 putative lipid-binding transport protein (Tim44 family) [Amphibacillus cookii]